jgi:hypothetical protein
MKLLTLSSNYEETILIAKSLCRTNQTKYNKNFIYHCYWNGELNEKHLYSIKSCYFFNIYKNYYNNIKIILWVEKTIKNKFYFEILKFAEIQEFNLQNEINNTFLFEKSFYYNYNLSFYSNTVRYLLLYKYGGIWFDLDIFFLRNFEPLIEIFGSFICVYQCEKQNYPNNSIFISLTPFDIKMKEIIEYIIETKRGWSFHENLLQYNVNLPFHVLPSSWFDPNQNNILYDNFFKKTEKQINFNTFFKGSFCYNWHNQWDIKIEKNSYFDKLKIEIDNNMI